MYTAYPLSRAPISTWALPPTYQSLDVSWGWLINWGNSPGTSQSWHSPAMPQLKKQKHSWKCFFPSSSQHSSNRCLLYLTSCCLTCSTVINYTGVMNGQTRTRSISHSSLTGQFEENWQCTTTCYSEAVGSWFHNPCKRRHCTSSTRVIVGARTPLNELLWFVSNVIMCCPVNVDFVLYRKSGNFRVWKFS